MIAPFSGLPHYDIAVAELYAAEESGKKGLRATAYRIRNAFVAYSDAVNYGQSEEVTV